MAMSSKKPQPINIIRLIYRNMPLVCCIDMKPDYPRGRLGFVGNFLFFSLCFTA